VYSTPLIINKTTGVKFGKSEGGAVWLDSTKTSVYAFYQFWLNLDDASVPDLLKVYTLLDKDEIERLSAQVTENPGAREAQKALARAVTTIVHGTERTESVERVTGVLFGKADFRTLQDTDLETLSREIPVVTLGKSLIEILVESGLASSNGEAKRLIESGAVSVNAEKAGDDQVVNTVSLIKKGKNSFILVR